MKHGFFYPINYYPLWQSSIYFLEEDKSKIIYCNIAIYKSTMGITKSDYFTENQNKTATVFKALGHPARLAIVEYLLLKKSCVCGDIVTELPLAQPTISQHLKELKSAGIIQGSIEGKTICYCLNPELFNYLENWLSCFAKQLKINSSNCC